jgi:NAD(P)-dependent dehydrogenase (short-subunit alcohol dehydrogenase family)
VGIDWTVDDIGDLSGRTYVVTGANSGLGYATARELALHGASVTLACRDLVKGAAALSAVRADMEDAASGAGGGDVGEERVDVRALDLADLASISSFAEKLASDVDGLDGLVNNAGVMAIPRRETADGFEMQFGTNHLGHFALTGRLLPLLLARPGARVVTISSGAHRMGRVKLDDLMAERRYSAWRAYGQSKLSNLLFAFELDRRARAAGRDLVSVAAHPGYAATNLQAVGPKMRNNRLMERFMELGNRLFGQTAEQGAIPQIYAATASEAEPGAYYGPDGLMEQRGKHPKKVGSTRHARDEDLARRLWEESERLTGVTYDFDSARV